MKQHKSRKAFTIVELVIVIAVIAVLAVVLVPTFSNMIAKAQDSKAMQEAKSAYTNYVADSDGETPECMVYQVGERFVAIHNGAPIGVFADKESALGAMMDEYDISKLVDTGDGKLWVYELKENDQIKVISDSLSFDPPPETGDLFERMPLPVVRMFWGAYQYGGLADGKTFQECLSVVPYELYCVWDSAHPLTMVMLKDNETGELARAGDLLDTAWAEAYQYALSARAIFEATPVTQSIDSLEIQEVYCWLGDIDSNRGYEVLIHFITNHGEYVLCWNTYDVAYGGKAWEELRPYLMPASAFYEYVKAGNLYSGGVKTDGLSEEYLAGDFEINETIANREWELQGNQPQTAPQKRLFDVDYLMVFC